MGGTGIEPVPFAVVWRPSTSELSSGAPPMTSACNVRFHVLSRSPEAWDKAITGVEGSRSAALKMTSIKVLRLLEDSDYDLRLELVDDRAGIDRKISSSR